MASTEFWGESTAARGSRGRNRGQAAQQATPSDRRNSVQSPKTPHANTATGSPRSGPWASGACRTRSPRETHAGRAASGRDEGDEVGDIAVPVVRVQDHLVLPAGIPG